MPDISKTDDTFMAAAGAARLSVAPMMDWTDRHCRYLHRLMSARTLLYTEMVTAAAIVRGGAVHLLEYDPAEQPVALQLGGSDPAELAAAAAIAAGLGYGEVNLNVGCPSDRVQSGCFGAVLMTRPELVAEALAEMRSAVAGAAEITVKCRIGVDDQTPEEILPEFLQMVHGAGVRRVAIHARKAWLDGLSPKQNRDIPPLDYPLVLAMKAAFGDMHISINGGIGSLDQAQEFLDQGIDGVMIGRAAYHTPADILLKADQRIFGAPHPPKTAVQIVQEMLPYIDRHIVSGGRLAQVTRHMLGLFAHRPGARHWRRHLSQNAHREGAGAAVVQEALEMVQGQSRVEPA